jgi:hypothetical protein
MHRFIWDLTYPSPDVLSHDYPISAIYRDTPLYPLGAAVLPDKYTVRLTVRHSPGGGPYGGAAVVWGNTQTLEIRMDPRVKTSPEDLRRQFELDRKIADALHRDDEALQQVRSLRSQLKAMKADGQAGMAKAASDLDSKAAAIEGTEGGYGSRYMSTPEGRSLARLNGGFSALLGALDTADAAPTTQQVTTFKELEKALQEQLSAWSQITSKDIPALNDELKKAGKTLIDLKKPAAENSAETGSKDRDQNEE